MKHILLFLLAVFSSDVLSKNINTNEPLSPFVQKRSAFHSVIEQPRPAPHLPARLKIVLSHFGVNGEEKIVDVLWSPRATSKSWGSFNKSVPVVYQKYHPYLEEGQMSTLPSGFSFTLHDNKDQVPSIEIFKSSPLSFGGSVDAFRSWNLEEGIQEHRFVLDKRRYKIMMIYITPTPMPTLDVPVFSFHPF